MDVVDKLNQRQLLLIAIVVSLVIALIKFIMEVSMALSVVDAQGGLVVLWACITSITIWGVLTLSTYKLMRAMVERDGFRVIASGLAVTVLLSIAAYSVTDSMDKKQALSDAGNPQTAPQRLGELVGYQSGFGYEIDNRIASNPATPSEILALLYGRHGQMGTDLNLASNPNTPSHILVQLSERNDAGWRE